MMTMSFLLLEDVFAALEEDDVVVCPQAASRSIAAITSPQIENVRLLIIVTAPNFLR